MCVCVKMPVYRCFLNFWEDAKNKPSIQDFFAVELVTETEIPDFLVIFYLSEVYNNNQKNALNNHGPYTDGAYSRNSYIL